MKRITLVTSAMLVFAVGVAAQGGPSKDMASLQGTWVVTSQDGQASSPADSPVTVVIVADKYSEMRDGQVLERGTFKLDSSKLPIAIDVFITEGDDANNTRLGVIRIENDTVTVKCSAPGATTRPVDFTPVDGSLVLLLKRVKTLWGLAGRP